ncbi:DUF6864 domain-containing function [Pseudomonas sp. NY15463]|uniref:DUF6864 domain-containing function n=1 Tax=Pseudomonas sp. NY15463 TaxID=3400361 RepID=UPI003A8484D4
MKKKLLIGDKEVLDSGLVILPANESVFSISLDDLVFCFEFISNSDKKDSIDTEIVGNELRFRLFNYDNRAGQGVTRTFADIGVIKGRPVGMAFMCYTNDNKSRVLEYTFVYLNSSL